MPYIKTTKTYHEIAAERLPKILTSQKCREENNPWPLIENVPLDIKTEAQLSLPKDFYLFDGVILLMRAKGYTLKAIGQFLNRSSERVRGMEVKALRKFNKLAEEDQTRFIDKFTEYYRSRALVLMQRYKIK